MGKSPGKWIKTVLFGKKASRSSISKGRYTSKASNEKETWIAAKEPTADLPVDPPSVSEPTTGPTDGNGGNSVSEKGITSNLSHEGISPPETQDADKQASAGFGALDDPDRIRLEQAATKAQAAFRGYLARRAFRALRGIIRLQALVRGHLVRRQAVATLRCLQSIIRLQALVRGRRVKLSDTGHDMRRKSSIRKPLDAKRIDSSKVKTSAQTERLLANAFVCKLLGSSPTAMPLRLQYGLEEPNSAWNWLERWSSSCFWEPLPRPKKNTDLKSQTRQGTSQMVETEPSRSKRTIRRGPAAHVDNGSINSNSESDKPKRSLRKVSSHPVDPVQEHPQNELEKVKRNLKKVSIVESTDRLEVETERPRRSLKKASTSPAPTMAAKGTFESSEKMKDITIAVPTEPDSETSLPGKPLIAEASVDALHEDHSPVELPSTERVEQEKNTPVANEESISKEDHNSNENHKTNRKRSSFPAKQENPENGLPKTPTLPSYMATTESAKAKFRGQSSPRFGQDGAENNGFTRRHSLPSSTNGKLSSLSPRPQRLVQASGKGGKNDRSLLSSRDGSEKVVQAEWRR